MKKIVARVERTSRYNDKSYKLGKESGRSVMRCLI